MQIPRKLILAGALFGLIPIGLGIAALVTQSWINLNGNNPNNGTYGLFSCKAILCSTQPGFTTVQGLEIAGVAAIAAGVVLAVLLDIFTGNRWIHLISQIFLFGGPTLILIGLILYAKYLFEYVTRSLLTQAGLSLIVDLGYSLILIIVTCLLGFFTAIYFGFIAGFGRYPRSVSPGRRSPIVFQQSERF